MATIYNLWYHATDKCNRQTIINQFNDFDTGEFCRSRILCLVLSFFFYLEIFMQQLDKCIDQLQDAHPISIQVCIH